jgi:hypothetical protein
MEAICSSETSVNSQRTARRYIPEDGTIYREFCLWFRFAYTKDRIYTSASQRLSSVDVLKESAAIFV